MGNHLILFFLKHDMDCAIELRDNGVKMAQRKDVKNLVYSRRQLIWWLG